MTKVITQNKYVHFTIATFMALFLFVSIAQAGQSWQNQNQNTKVKGTWSIEQRSDGNYLVLDDAFKTKNAPDLKFFVTNTSAGDVTGKNATDSAVEIAKLTSNKGAQSYKIPASVDVSNYKTLVLHCEQYSKLWAATPLK